MNRIRIFRSALLWVVIALLVTALPARAQDASGGNTALAIDPKTPTTLYAGTCDRGLFKSMDGGASWTATVLSRNVYIWAIAVDPQTPTTLYVAASSHDCTGAWGVGDVVPNVYRSTDGGMTWTPTGLPGVIQPTVLAIDPKVPSRLYAGSFWYGMFVSEDGGATWTGSGLYSVSSLAVDPVTPGIVYAATELVGDEGFNWYGGVYQSTDGGASWAFSGPGIGSFGSLAIDPRSDRDPLSPAVLYASGDDISNNHMGLFRTTDGGANWSVVSFPDWGATLAIDPKTPTTIYAGSSRGALKSTDGGATWNPINKGLTDTLLAYGFPPNVGLLVVDPLTTNMVYASTGIGLFKSVDGGADWNPTGFFQQSPLVSLGVNPTSVFYGAASTGTVTLVSPAPAGGTTVVLASSNPSIARVPATLTVPAGATSATFSISTTPDPWTPWTLNISATLNGVTKSANLVVTATTISSMFLSPTTVAGGTSSTGTVGLSSAAPAGGATIAVSSANPAVASVPTNVTVPAGATWASFAVTTNSPSTSAAVSISAANYRAVLTVTPAPPTILSSISLNPATVSSGSSSNGTLTLSAPAPAGGATVSLASSAPAIANIPAAVTVVEGGLAANFSVISIACTAGSATVSATYGGMTQSAAFNVISNADNLGIGQATYSAGKRELRVTARSSDRSATLGVYVTSSGVLIGTMRNVGDGNYSGTFVWPVTPANITVRSSSCGTASTVVTKK